MQAAAGAYTRLEGHRYALGIRKSHSALQRVFAAFEVSARSRPVNPDPGALGTPPSAVGRRRQPHGALY